jgi:hypothetical protein
MKTFGSVIPTLMSKNLQRTKTLNQLFALIANIPLLKKLNALS